jgi:hypothetical protein
MFPWTYTKNKKSAFRETKKISFFPTEIKKKKLLNFHVKINQKIIENPYISNY